MARSGFKRVARVCAAGLVLVMGLALVAGCGPKVPKLDSERAHTLIVALPGDVNSLDHDKASGLARSMDINVLDWQWIKFDTKDVNGIPVADREQMVPGIVENWSTEALPDGRVKHIFKVRKGATFHSGNPVTAWDLKWAMERRAGLKGDYVHRALGAMYGLPELPDTLLVPDDYTLEVISTQDMPYFWDIWAQRVYFDSKYVKEHAAADDPWGLEICAKEDVGSGPFKVASWTAGVEMVLEPFEGYFGKKPWFDKVVYKIIPDLSARVMMLETGEVDVAMGIPTKEMDQLADAEGVRIISAPSMTQVFITMNANFEPFNDQKVREALSYAFPYQDIMTNVYYGQAQQMNGPIPTGMRGALEQRPFPTDLEKAKQILADAGKSNIEVTLSYCADYPEHEKIGVLFQSNLRDIGVTCNLQQLPVGEFESQARERTIPFAVRSGSGYIWDPAYMIQMWFLSDSTININDYNNPEADQIIKQALAETDADARAALVEEAQDIVVADIPSIYIGQPNFRLAMREDIAGYKHQNTEYLHLWELYREGY